LRVRRHLLAPQHGPRQLKVLLHAVVHLLQRQPQGLLDRFRFLPWLLPLLLLLMPPHAARHPPHPAERVTPATAAHAAATAAE